MKQIRNNKENLQLILTVLFAIAYVFGATAVLAATGHILYGYSSHKHLFLLIGSMSCWMIAQCIAILSKWMIYKQFLVIDLGMAVIFGLLTVIGENELEMAGHPEFWRSYVVICLASIVPVLFNWIYNKKMPDRISWHACCKWIVSHKYIILAEILTLIVVIVQSGSEARWDGAYVYQYIHDEVQLSDIFNLSQLSFCGHLDMTYIAMNKILEVLWGSLSTGMAAGTIILILGSEACVYGIMKHFVKDRSDLEYAIMAVFYVTSPFILGLSSYNYWDSWVILLFPLLIYSSIKERWIIHLTIAFVFCFIKETAIVAYAGYAAGIVLADWIRNRNLKHIVKCKHYWGMLMVGLSWLYLYIKLPNWDGVGGFKLDGIYILQKLKVMYILNFNWILSILALGAIIILLLKKRIINNLIFPILLSDMFFVAFSCLFETVNHARYIDTHIIVLNLLTIMGIELMGRVCYRYVFALAIIMIMLVSNYLTIDPLTKIVFQKYNVGKVNMVSTCQGEYLSDSMVYNQQYRYFDKALDKALTDVVKENNIMFYPVMGDRTWFFMGSYCKTDELTMQYWDKEHKCHTLYQNSNSSSFSLCNITSADVAVELLNGQAGYYFYIPCAGEKIAEDLRKQTRILEEQDFTYRGWTVTRIKFEEK